MPAFSSAGNVAFFSSTTARARSTASSSRSRKATFSPERVRMILTILAEDRAEGDVRERYGVAQAAHDGVELLEMQRLRRADHVPERPGLKLIDPLFVSGEVGRGVVEGAVALADDRGTVGQFRVIREEDDDCPFAGFRDPRLLQLLDHGASWRLKKTLAELVVEPDIQPRVDLVQFGAGEIDAALPDRGVFRVPGLELDQFVTALLDRVQQRLRRR